MERLETAILADLGIPSLCRHAADRRRRRGSRRDEGEMSDPQNSGAGGQENVTAPIRAATVDPAKPDRPIDVGGRPKIDRQLRDTLEACSQRRRRRRQRPTNGA
jgi:hypothetical protein